MSYRIVLEKENFKFSGSHFTIFGSHESERLHGHNYYVTVELECEAVDPSLGLIFDFNEVKPMVREITDSLDEYVLLPDTSPHLKIERRADSVRAVFAKKAYELPLEDVRLLPVVNVTAEELARYIADRLAIELTNKKSLAGSFASSLTSLSVGVQETRGQSVYYRREMNRGEK